MVKESGSNRKSQPYIALWFSTTHFKTLADFSDTSDTVWPPFRKALALLTWVGIMGFCMALNLASKLPPHSHLNVYDISSKVLDKFRLEVSRNSVIVCHSPRDVAEKSVSIPILGHIMR